MKYQSALLMTGGMHAGCMPCVDSHLLQGTINPPAQQLQGWRFKCRLARAPPHLITSPTCVTGVPAKLKSACHNTPAANKSEAAPHLGAEAAWGLAGGMPSLEPCGTFKACGAFEAWGAFWAWLLGDTEGAGWLGRGLDPKGGLASVRMGASAGLTEASASEGPLLAGSSCRSMRLHQGGSGVTRLTVFIGGTPTCKKNH